MRLTPLLLLSWLLMTCCPPDPVKPTAPRSVDHAGSASGSAAPPAKPGDPLDALADGTQLHGFTVRAIYTDDRDRRIGARLIHDRTKFTFDYLQVETAPQGFIWVNSLPTSDQGEPHTQEHLLLGKGERGRRFGSTEAMALAESSAFTAQWRTAYHFHTVAGNEVYWSVFENQLDALLNPDYTDEEIRREVRNFGVDKGDDGKLRLEEKGTVYNEMVRTYESPDTVMWRRAGQLVYGERHPMALDSGGHPDAIRTMTPGDIRRFHRDNYHLANMGVIAAFPSKMTFAHVLDQTAAVLDRHATTRPDARARDITSAGPPQPAKPGTIAIEQFPYSDAAQPGPLMLAWPATRALDNSERLLLGLFLDAFAGDESTPLYGKLIDSKTRVLDLGARAVWTWTTDDPGQPIYLGLSGVKADKLDTAGVEAVRALVTGELARIAKLPDSDPELAALNDRVRTRAIDLERRLRKFLDSPPGFGIRGTGAEWNDHLYSLNKASGFVKSLTQRPAIAGVRAAINSPGNPWRDRLQAWGLLDVPFGVAAKPSPQLRAKLDGDRKQRIESELARLTTEYKTATAQPTLARYQQDYDAATRKLESSAASALPPLVDSPPMTLDDGLQFTTATIGGAPMFAATFDSMTSARVQLSFAVTPSHGERLGVYLAALPTLVADAGVIIDGKPIAANAMREQIRREILELTAYYTSNVRTRRSEFVVSGSGSGAGETKTALTWMRRIMLQPDWRPDNVARLRDLVDQQLSGARQRMLGAEEGWVTAPRDAWRHQSALLARLGLFLTQAHDLWRVRWRLMEGSGSGEAASFLDSLADAAKLPRAQLSELADALAKLDGKAKPKAAKWYAAALQLPTAVRGVARAAGKDLAQLLGDLPDSSLADDWTYLTKQMAADFRYGIANAVNDLEQLRRSLIDASRMRVAIVSSSFVRRDIEPSVASLVGDIPRATTPLATATAPADVFRTRVRQRRGGAVKFVGLFAPGTSSGVFLNTAKAPWYGDTSDQAVLDYLAGNLYTGHGGHSMFMKTWAAGLAYSNGLRPNIASGQLVYYAERTPLLPQTLRFVIGELRKAKPDDNLARYAIAQSFGSRIATGYEARALAMDADLVDGQSGEVVTAFRRRILEIAKRPDLTAQLFNRMEQVYGSVLPGYGKPSDPDATYFVIGPDKQLAAYEGYLQATFGKDTKLERLYPRDFWITQ